MFRSHVSSVEKKEKKGKKGKAGGQKSSVEFLMHNIYAFRLGDLGLWSSSWDSGVFLRFKSHIVLTAFLLFPFRDLSPPPHLSSLTTGQPQSPKYRRCHRTNAKKMLPKKNHILLPCFSFSTLSPLLLNMKTRQLRLSVMLRPVMADGDVSRDFPG